MERSGTVFHLAKVRQAWKPDLPLDRAGADLPPARKNSTWKPSSRERAIGSQAILASPAPWPQGGWLEAQSAPLARL